MPKIHADYKIEISDPLNGKAKHDVHKPPSAAAKKTLLYRLTRMVYFFGDLDFHIHKDDYTMLKFKLVGNENLIFDPATPITFESGGQPGKIINEGNPQRELNYRFPGSSGQANKYKYSLHYVDKSNSGKKYEYDPVIRNGSSNPITRIFFVISTVLIAGFTISKIAGLI